MSPVSSVVPRSSNQNRGRSQKSSHRVRRATNAAAVISPDANSYESEYDDEEEEEEEEEWESEESESIQAAAQKNKS